MHIGDTLKEEFLCGMMKKHSNIGILRLMIYYSRQVNHESRKGELLVKEMGDKLKDCLQGHRLVGR